MAISSNKSSFPISSKTNSDSKTPESSSNTLIRKSFNGNPSTKPSIVANSRSFNPVTPANSPAEFSRKSLGSKEGFSTLRGSNEYKENEKDQKRVKEGFVSKGTKSFMAPTISAISKISPSPRKKVLTDRNETVRSSIADSEGKSLMVEEDLSELTEEIGSQVLSEPQNHSFKPRVIKFEEPKTDSIASSIPESLNIAATPLISSSNSLEIKAIGETSLKSEIIHKPPASPCPVVASLDSDPLFPHCEFKAKNVSSSSKGKTPSSPIAPLDSDPHIPPYDPKTNYLSPRPRFLHYKPKPRVEVCLNEENESDSSEGKKLEDSFTSESCSDTEKTEETQSSGSLKESEDGCNSELTSEEDRVETRVTETELEYTQLKEVSKISKSSSFVRLKIGPLLMVFLITCVFIPVIDTPVLLPSGQPYKFDGSAKLAEFAKANIDELALNVKFWSAKTFSYVSTLISTPREAVELHPLYFSNLTVSNEGPLLNDDYQFKES
ncbi:transmembrane protein, partial [Thalictrum thalictroides]